MHYPARPPRFLRRPSGLQRASVSLFPPVLELLGPVSARWSLHEVGIGSYTPSEPGSSHTGLILQHSKLLEWSARPPAPAAATSLPCLTRQRTPGRSVGPVQALCVVSAFCEGLGRASSLQDRGSLCSSPEALAGREAEMAASFCSPAWYQPQFAAGGLTCSLLMSAGLCLPQAV